MSCSVRSPNGSAPGWWGAASEASGGGRGMVRKEVRERATAQLANLRITPPPAKLSFIGGV